MGVFFQLMKEEFENLNISWVEEIKLLNRHLGKKNQYECSFFPVFLEVIFQDVYKTANIIVENKFAHFIFLRMFLAASWHFTLFSNEILSQNSSGEKKTQNLVKVKV